MSDDLDLTGDIALAIDAAAQRGHTLAVGYLDDDGYPAVSFRGSTQVHGPRQLAIWARRPDDGFAQAIATRPRVTLVYYGGPGGPGPMFLSIRGHARIDPAANAAVYAGMIEGERTRAANSSPVGSGGGGARPQAGIWATIAAGLGSIAPTIITCAAL